MRTARPVWWLLLAAGLVAFALTAALPWRTDDFRLGLGIRLVMALAGATLLVLVARARSQGAPVTATGLLGASVLAYPSLLALAAADLGPVTTQLGAAGHVLPLTLVQLVPVLTSGHVLGSRHRRWEIVIVATAVTGVALVGLGLAGVPGAAILLTLSTVLWFGSFVIAPVVTWTAVRGTGGETRHRALVAALAALTPVVVISWCLTLGAASARLGQDAAVSALMLGFAAGTLSCGVLALGACAPAGSPALLTSVVIGALHLLLAALVLIVGGLAALATSALGVPPGWALLLGAVVTIVAGVPWWRLHDWTRRVVDPAAALRHELTALGPVAAGQHRQAAVHALRRVTGDPGLEVVHAVTERDAAADPVEPDGDPDGDMVPLVYGHGGRPTVLARAVTPAGTRRLRALGDCSDLLHAAVLEAQLSQEGQRADAAARHERERLSQDLHDGLQGRLLGLALQLQLGARTLDDPASRLLAEEAVESLRAAVEDVRALGGGRLPDVLAREGLQPALATLFRPIDYLVELDLPATRFGAEAEATTYFVIGEAVSNALKHSQAERIRVQVQLRGRHQVAISVRDDGRGGADPRMGSGLRGLSERVAAVGGVLVVHDEDGGTAVEAVLPCGS